MSESDLTLVTFTDGGARGNPGPAGIGVVMFTEDQFGNRTHILDYKEYIGEQTNNFAEYTALNTALQKGLDQGFTKVICYLDSELVVKQLNGQYKIREESLKPLATKAITLARKYSSYSFNHVKREKNASADRLVNEALDEAAKTI